jgi:hypothetical protein
MRRLYLVEVKQAGIFSIAGATVEDLKRLIGSFCPSVLFPYAREVMSDLIVKGGFPNFLLPLVNFDALFAQAPKRRKPAWSTRRLTCRRRQQPMTVIGAGSWGTALAIQLAREGHPIHLWGRDAAQLDAMRAGALQCATCPMRLPARANGVRPTWPALGRRAGRIDRRALARVPSHPGTV